MGPDFSGSITQQTLSPSIKIGEVYTDPIGLVRTPRLLKEAPTDEVLMLIHLEGDGQAVQEEHRRHRIQLGLRRCDDVHSRLPAALRRTAVGGARPLIARRSRTS